MILVSQIQRAVADHYGLSVAELLSATRQRRIARPRQIGMYLARRHSACSLPDIARRFGLRNHTTALHAIRNVENLIGRDIELWTDVESVEARLALEADLCRLVVGQPKSFVAVAL